MDMQEKQLPVFGEEDPALPWPGHSEMIATMKTVRSAVSAAASAAPAHHDMDMNNGMDMEGEAPHHPNDSIDPRLLSLGMGFVPYQAWETPSAFDVSLQRGTIFPSLYFPWHREEAQPR